jgi:hypothetical protein
MDLLVSSMLTRRVHIGEEKDGSSTGGAGDGGQEGDSGNDSDSDGDW